MLHQLILTVAYIPAANDLARNLRRRLMLLHVAVEVGLAAEVLMASRADGTMDSCIPVFGSVHGVWGQGFVDVGSFCPWRSEANVVVDSRKDVVVAPDTVTSLFV